jgi:hypothetical protein
LDEFSVFSSSQLEAGEAKKGPCVNPIKEIKSSEDIQFLGYALTQFRL